MRFFTFLLLFLFFLSSSPKVQGQNLIYDWSAEEYTTCPTGLALTMFIPTWLSMRGNPDYFNSCSPDLGPLTNPFGWQQPKSGEAIMGVITYHSSLPNGREYPGIELLDTLIIGELYDISYYVATAFNPNASGRVCNNLGILLMTENYLDPNELGTIPNFAHVNADTIIADTMNWVHIAGTIIADSAYNYVAFGNFYDDGDIEFALIDPLDPDSSNLAYYYFDDFCVVPTGGECNIVLDVRNRKSVLALNLYPNPVANTLHLESTSAIQAIKVYGADGVELITLSKVKIADQFNATVDVSGISPGVYIVISETEEGIGRNKIVINP